jgi:hypothetical protein
MHHAHQNSSSLTKFKMTIIHIYVWKLIYHAYRCHNYQNVSYNSSQTRKYLTSRSFFFLTWNCLPATVFQFPKEWVERIPFLLNCLPVTVFQRNAVFFPLSYDIPSIQICSETTRWWNTLLSVVVSFISSLALKPRDETQTRSKKY